MDVYKKLELNPLRLDGDIRVIGSKTKHFQKISLFHPVNEKRRTPG